MGKNLSSADITFLDFTSLLNFSTATPAFSVTNNSTVVDAANLQWVFELYSPSGTPIHVGTFDAPDIDGVPFTTFVFSEAIPQVFGQLEFTKKDGYSIKVLVKDSNGDVYDLTKSGAICKPSGNTGKSNFGAAQIEVKTNCGKGKLYVTDNTNLLYKGLTGTKITTQVDLTYPKDPTGNTLAPVTVQSLPALLPIKYEGEGYNIYVAHVYEYDLGDGFKVRVRFSFSSTFAVWCNVNLCPLFCEYDKLLAMVDKNCDAETKAEQNAKLQQINGKLMKCVIGILQPLCQYDVPAIIEEIKEIGGFTCDCCRPAGLSNVGAVTNGDVAFTVNKVCGDMTMSWETDGEGNFVLNYQNYSYVFSICDVAGNSDAFEFRPSTTGCVKSICLMVDLTILSGEILRTIRDNTYLLTLLQSLITQATLSCNLDGKGIINTSSCTYSAQLSVGSGNTVGAIYIGGTSYPAPTGTLVSNASAIQIWLNSLSLGAFSASYSSGTQKTTITSTNTNLIANISYYTGGIAENRYVVQFNSDCNTICNILQQIINYLKNLNLLQIGAGQDYTVCGIKSDGSILAIDVPSTATAADLIKIITDQSCATLNYIKDKLVSCANVKALFSAFTNKTGNPNGADVFLMIKDGKCQQVPLKNAAIGIFNQLCSDSEVKSAYCACAKCTTVSNCSPVTNLTGSAGDTTANYTWDAVAAAIAYKWSIDGTNWHSVTSTAALVTGLTAGTSYVFRVYPVYNNGDGSDCVVTNNFTTTDAGSGCAAPENLVLDNVTANGFRATWNAFTGASGYQYRVNGGSWVNAGLVTTVTLTGLTASTSYNFELRVVIGGEPCTDIASDSATTLPECTDSESMYCSDVQDYYDDPAYGKLHILTNISKPNVVNSSTCCVTIEEVHFNSNADTLINPGDIVGRIDPTCLPTCPEGMTRTIAVTQVTLGHIFNLMSDGTLVWAGPSFTLYAIGSNPVINYPGTGANELVIKQGVSCCVADETGS